MKIVILFLMLAVFVIPNGCQADESILTLKDYPQIFGEATIIITGDNASLVETEGAEIIADNLKKETGNEVTIIDITGMQEADRIVNNLIFLMTPDSNGLIAELLDKAGISPVTSEYPGVNKGILEIVMNPWNEGKAVLLVGGGDQWGLKAAMLMLEDLKLKRVSQSVVDWEDYTGVEFPIDSESEAIRYAKLDHDVRAYIDWLMKKEYGVQFWAHQNPDSFKWEVGIGAKSREVSDVWMDIFFLPDGTIVSKREGRV